jgi:hypothetical protein
MGPGSRLEGATYSHKRRSDWCLAGLPAFCWAVSVC